MSNKKSPKLIKFTPRLKEYLDETLELEKLKKLNKTDGTTIGRHDRLRIRNNDEKKVRTLDGLIFESMANLIYFFEFLNNHPDLIDKFGEDIHELFGLQAQEYRILPRFLRAILGYHLENDTGSGERFNFRRRLLQNIQHCVTEVALPYVMSLPYKDGRFRRMIIDDLRRAEAWINFFDKPIAREHKKSKRLMGF